MKSMPDRGERGESWLGSSWAQVWVGAGVGPLSAPHNEFRYPMIFAKSVSWSPPQNYNLFGGGGEVKVVWRGRWATAEIKFLSSATWSGSLLALPGPPAPGPPAPASPAPALPATIAPVGKLQRKALRFFKPAVTAEQKAALQQQREQQQSSPYPGSKC